MMKRRNGRELMVGGRMRRKGEMKNVKGEREKEIKLDGWKKERKDAGEERRRGRGTEAGRRHGRYKYEEKGRN